MLQGGALFLLNQSKDSMLGEHITSVKCSSVRNRCVLRMKEKKSNLCKDNLHKLIEYAILCNGGVHNATDT